MEHFPTVIIIGLQYISGPLSEHTHTLTLSQLRLWELTISVSFFHLFVFHVPDGWGKDHECQLEHLVLHAHQAVVSAGIVPLLDSWACGLSVQSVSTHWPYDPVHGLAFLLHVIFLPSLTLCVK